MTADMSNVLVDVANDGERLVPGESHDIDEVIRHKSSYQFFKRIIATDLFKYSGQIHLPVRILDIGCGSGHGTFMLSDLIGVEITAIDPSEAAIIYAREHYGASNIDYIATSCQDFQKRASAYDYIVSRHALEHFDDGLNYVLNIQCNKRLIVNVPYNEAEGNIHHKVHRITESDFKNYKNKEFFYEDLAGVTRLDLKEEPSPNSIICASTYFSDAVKISEMLAYPVASWRPDSLQYAGLLSMGMYADLVTLNQKLASATEQLEQLTAHHIQLSSRYEALSRSLGGRLNAAWVKFRKLITRASS